MGRVPLKPSFDVVLSWLRFDPDVPHLWDFSLWEGGALGCEDISIVCTFRSRWLGAGALLVDNTPCSGQPCPFPRGSHPFPSHPKTRRGHSHKEAFPAPCRLAVSLPRHGSTSLFFWLHKMEMEWVPKDGSQIMERTREGIQEPDFWPRNKQLSKKL